MIKFENKVLFVGFSAIVPLKKYRKPLGGFFCLNCVFNHSCLGLWKTT